MSLLNVLIACLQLVLVILTNIEGNRNPPFSITITPFLIFSILFVGIPQYKKNYSFSILYHSALFLLNDFLIRKYAGGTHDLEGNAWIMMMSFIGFIILAIFSLIYIRLNMNQPTKTKLIFWGCCMSVVVFMYLFLLANYGIDTYY